MSNLTYCVVYCTCPNQQLAESMARQLTESRLVACTNIIPGLTSIYRWQDEIKTGSEVLMMMKTTKDKLTELEKAVVALHPYDFPEFIAVPIVGGNQPYLDWLQESVANSP